MYNRDKLMDIAEVIELLEKHIDIPEDQEAVELERAIGRINAVEIRAMFDHPASPRSAMDGYAVRYSDIAGSTSQHPVRIKRVGEIYLSKEGPSVDPDNTCVKIPTGAVLPEGYDTVIPNEELIEKDAFIEITATARQGENVDQAGRFHRKGDIIVERGIIIGPQHIGAVASIGIKEMIVRRKIEVSLISTGSELIAPGERLPAWGVYESNSFGAKTLLEGSGQFTVKSRSIVKDEVGDLKAAIEIALRTSDVVITFGGTALGSLDLMPKVMATEKPGIIFHGINVRPGAPTMFTLTGKKYIISLPGPTVSAFLVLAAVFMPVLLRKAGLQPHKGGIMAQLDEDIHISRNKFNIVPVKLTSGDNSAHPYQGSSAAFIRLSRSDGYFTHQGDADMLKKGTWVSVIPFFPVNSV